MDASPIKAVADWMKTADLAEVVYRKNGTGFSLTALGALAKATRNRSPSVPSVTRARTRSPGSVWRTNSTRPSCRATQ